MFDETKDVWIKIYKVVTIIMFFTIIIGGFIGFIILGLERLAAVGFLVFIISIISAFIALAMNMLILNLLANVQIIRKNTEKSVTWRCSCGAVNSGSFCTSCGRSKP